MTRGEHMRMARKNAGLSQRALAKMVGVGDNTICFLETGKTQGTIETIEMLADALGLSIDEYIGHNVAPRKLTETEIYFGGRNE